MKSFKSPAISRRLPLERLHGSPLACSRRRSTNYTNTPSRGAVLRAFTLMYFILHHVPPTSDPETLSAPLA